MNENVMVLEEVSEAIVETPVLEETQSDLLQDKGLMLVVTVASSLALISAFIYMFL